MMRRPAPRIAVLLFKHEDEEPRLMRVLELHPRIRVSDDYKPHVPRIYERYDLPHVVTVDKRHVARETYHFYVEAGREVPAPNILRAAHERYKITPHHWTRLVQESEPEKFVPRKTEVLTLDLGLHDSNPK